MEIENTSSFYDVINDNLDNFTQIVINIGTNDLYLEYFYNIYLNATSPGIVLHEFIKDLDKFTEGYIQNLGEIYNKLINFISEKYKIIMIAIPCYCPVDDDNIINMLKYYDFKKKLPSDFDYSNLTEIKMNHIFTNKHIRDNIILFKKYLQKRIEDQLLKNVHLIDINVFITDEYGNIKKEYKLDNPIDIHFEWKPLMTAYKTEILKNLHVDRFVI